MLQHHFFSVWRKKYLEWRSCKLVVSKTDKKAGNLGSWKCCVLPLVVMPRRKWQNRTEHRTEGGELHSIFYNFAVLSPAVDAAANPPLAHWLVTLKQLPQSFSLHSHFLKAPWNEWSAATTRDHIFFHLCKLEQAALYSYLCHRELLRELGEISGMLRAATTLAPYRSHHGDLPMPCRGRKFPICRIPAAGSGVVLSII